jgi:hypothetical protein
VGPVFDNDLLPLIAAYRDLREEDPVPERSRRLGVFVVDLLHASGVEAALRGHESPIVAFRHNEQPFLMGLSWTREAIGAAVAAEVVRSLHADAGDATAILLSMSGYDSQTPGPALGATSGRTLLWDRTYLEAVLCGLATVSDLLAAGTRIAFFQAAPYVMLTRLLAGEDGAPHPRMATPDQHTLKPTFRHFAGAVANGWYAFPFGWSMLSTARTPGEPAATGVGVMPPMPGRRRAVSPLTWPR